MIFGHIEEETLFAFSLDELSPEERDAVQTHLDSCASCSQVVVDYREIAALTSDPATWQLIDDAASFTPDPERVRDFGERARRKETEDHAAAEALRELQQLSLDGWSRWLRERTELRTAGMAAALLAEARKRVHAQPRQSLRIVAIASHIAWTLTDRLDRSVLMGMAANERATVLRFLGENEQALAAVEEADAQLNSIGSAPDEKARVSWNRATVLWALERYPEARVALVAPKDWFRSIGDELELARIGILEASILHDEGDYVRALALLTQAAQILEAQPEQPELAVVYANMAFCHLGLGDLEAARRYGKRAMATYDHVDMRSERIRTRWMFAQLLIESGNVEEGLADLRTAAREYEEAGIVAEAALVDLERVEVLLHIDRWEEAASIARRLVVVYERGKQRISYIRALTCLREAVEATTATPALARYVRGYLADTAHPPFRPPDTPLPS